MSTKIKAAAMPEEKAIVQADKAAILVQQESKSGGLRASPYDTINGQVSKYLGKYQTAFDAYEDAYATNAGDTTHIPKSTITRFNGIISVSWSTPPTT